MGILARHARLNGAKAVQHRGGQFLRRFPIVFVDAGIGFPAPALLPPRHNALQDFLDPGPIDGGGFAIAHQPLSRLIYMDRQDEQDYFCLLRIGFQERKHLQQQIQKSC